MTYAIVGFGKVSQAVDRAFARKGIEVSVASRRPPEELALAAREILSKWISAQAKIDGTTTEEAEQAFLEDNRPSTLIHRFATTFAVAHMIGYVCSEQSSATSGAALRVDGDVVRFVA